MSPPQLLPELWTIVISHLRQPVPPPLSQPLRSAVRHHDLTSVMRVNKLLRSIARPFLYSTIVTDNLPLLLRELPNSSMKLNTSFTRSLFIEYSEKDPRPTYETLLRRSGKWILVGRSTKLVQAYIVSQCELEVKNLFNALQMTVWNGHTLRTAFPRLRTVAVSSIYGKVDQRWRWYENKHERGPNGSSTSRGFTCKSLFDTFITGLNIRQLCVRDPNGPLSIPEIALHLLFPSKSRHDRTIHFDETIDALFLPPGKPVKYISDAPSSIPWQFVAFPLHECLLPLAEDRQKIARHQPNHPAATEPFILSVYASTPLVADKEFSTSDFDGRLDRSGKTIEPSVDDVRSVRLDRSEEEKMVAMLGQSMQNNLRNNSGLKDLVNWYTSYETPICIACGSGAPLEEEVIAVEVIECSGFSTLPVQPYIITKFKVYIGLVT